MNSKGYSYLKLFGLSMAVVAMVGCSNMQARETNNARLARYEASAGGPVKQFNYFNLYSWESLGDNDLVVWTRPHEAWLLTVSAPCRDLEFSNTIELSTVMGNHVGTMDYVIAGHQRCRITTIRPLDTEKLKESRPRAS